LTTILAFARAGVETAGKKKAALADRFEVASSRMRRGSDGLAVANPSRGASPPPHADNGEFETRFPEQTTFYVCAPDAVFIAQEKGPDADGRGPVSSGEDCGFYAASF
jgi:hypothetical protein